MQWLQLVMSSSTVDPYCPLGQASQAVALENGLKVGFAMNVPGEQHPKRPVIYKEFPVLPPPLKACHWPPHSVRLKPLSINTAREGCNKEKEKPTHHKQQ
jgi:hypothetical protein